MTDRQTTVFIPLGGSLGEIEMTVNEYSQYPPSRVVVAVKIKEFCYFYYRDRKYLTEYLKVSILLWM